MNVAAEVEKSREQVTKEVLSRFSVLDLIEMGDADISKGEQKLFRSQKPVKVIEKGETNLIRWWTVQTDTTAIYHVRRFENFVWCSCPDFFYTRTEDKDGNRKATMCKHLSVTLRWYCRRCRKKDVEYGSLCRQCDMDTSPILKPTPQVKRERIGNIWI